MGRPCFHPAVVKRIARAVEPDFRPRLALDVGCGTGMSAVSLTEIVPKVIGIDSAEEMLGRASTHEGVRYVRGSAESIPLRAGIADLIAVGCAFHWFDVERFLKEAGRVASRDARLVVYDHFIAGMDEDARFRSWFFEDYLSEFPMPPRDSRPIEDLLSDRDDWRLDRTERYEDSISLSLSSLIDYLSSQSNVISRVEGRGVPLEGIRATIQAELAPFFAERDRGTFRFEGPITLLRPAGSS